ncbi:MAG TPA: hypothetical protein VMN57_00850 [Anaerolineales bacterium]|nr:hypothetical protein [Anaerolineales bacterium]
MTTIGNVQPKTSLLSNWLQLVARLNGSLHEKALWVYVFIVVAHWMEHLIQAYQIFVSGWARSEARGMLGLWMPGLVSSEILHFAYAVFVIGGLILLRPGMRGLARFWWDAALIFQAWHLVEHSLLQWQVMVNDFFFGASIPLSLLQVWVPRVELHLFYNVVVTVPTLIGLYFHRYPPRRERGIKTDCSCSQE